ncbi:hypothetical protein TL16_g00036 [Triparma laevis f. inornata]|uniref:Uncharacterized protein n=1 Tax=Triparma laevis f. inornata TaxID=1714386 RepID=A0A9W7DQR5_9STRA|nr:hypothetical protein TL16_g00036 [Triparma laevis f. inornata]
MNALGKNREDTYFSSVKWGGTPGGNIQNFTKTMKSIPAPTERYSRSKIYPKKLSSTSPTKVHLPSLTIEAAGVARIDHGDGGITSASSPENRQRQFWRSQADAILSRSPQRNGGMSRVSSLNSLGSPSNKSVQTRMTMQSSKSNTSLRTTDTRQTMVGSVKSGQARELLNLGKKNKKTLDTFLETTTSPGNTSERKWVDSYGDDRGTFVSFARWAQIKLTEAIQLAECGALPKNLIASLCAQLCLESVPRLSAITPYVPVAIDTVFRSVFILTHEGKPTCTAAAQILERDQDIHKIFAVEGVLGFRQRLNLFLACPTYHDHVRWLWAKLKHELALRPALEVRIAARAKERQMEARAMEAACDRWARMKTYAIFYNWVGETEMDKKRHLLGKFMFYMSEIKPKDLFLAWKNWYREEKRTRERLKYKNAKEEAERLKAELEKVRKHNSDMQKKIAILRKEIAILKKKLGEALDILLQPARQPSVLEKVLKGLKKPLDILQNLLQNQLEEQVNETHRVGADTLRLAPLYTWRGVKRGNYALDDLRTAENELDDESDYEDDVETKIREWLPGKLPSKEFTPAFYPFNTRPGNRLRRWGNILLRKDWIDGCPDEERGKVWKAHEDMADVKGWKSITRSVGKITPQPEMNRFVMPERICDDYFVQHPNVPEAMHFCEYVPSMNPTVGRYFHQQCITGEEPPKTPEEIAAAQERRRRLNAREKETGIVVHIMSKYMGMRVHVMDTGEQKSAALMSELFAHHFKTQELWEGFKDKQLLVFTQKFLQGWEQIMIKLADVMSNADASSTMKIGDRLTVPMWVPEYTEHGILKQYAKEFKNLHNEAKKAANTIIGDYLECLEDRQRFRDHIHDNVGYTWQSLCTTILSRRLRTEEDIDDGTFTTIDKTQFANEFKRLGILSEEMRDEQCAEMKKVLKMRIRDLKRIFQYYAAAGDGGPATTMDHGEFWKFVKDSKLQKDRKAMPSVRVDLIFQCCNIDYALEGKDRLASDDGELEPHEFVEGLARLCVYRYTKGTPAQRLQKMLEEEVLPNACSVDTDVFRERIAGDRVKDVFAKHKHNMKIIYKVFAADDQEGDAALAGDTMNSNELVSFCREFEMVGPLLSERAVKVLFAYVQQEEEMLDEDEGNDDVGDSEMVYSEFVESQAAIGCQMRPDPYNVVEIRIDHFISQEIIPRALDGCACLRFRGKGLRKLPKPEGSTGE